MFGIETKSKINESVINGVWTVSFPIFLFSFYSSILITTVETFEMPL